MGMADDICGDADKLAEEIYSDPFGDKDEIAAAILRGFIARGQKDAKALAFWQAQAKWSRETFGSDADRGPSGPAKHLKKEVQEVLDALAAGDLDHAKKELVDCQFLVFDAARRSGLSFDMFFAMCFSKLAENQARTWNKATDDEPVEHVR